MELMPHQLEVIDLLASGKILHGVVGSGKSAAILGYYVKNETPKDIVVITTAKKRDSLEWEEEAAKFGIGTEREGTLHGTITIDSWNNMHKYISTKGTFFVFDEQRLAGHGSWVKNFLKIAKNNHWVMLTATPGDTWLDYAPVFIANGFYKNITDFKFKHVLYEPFLKYPKVRGYLNERKLELLRNEILVEMPYIKSTKIYMNYMDVDYDKELIKRIYKERWNIYEDRPIKDGSEMFRVMRRVINSDPSRIRLVRELLGGHPRLIIFYNFDYELEILRTLADEITVLEWNGHKKDKIPDIDRWVYLVQYISGAEAWNCTETNGMVLYSLTYSYKNFVQARGRIDRLDTKFDSLFYYILTSNSNIDKSVLKSLSQKKSFNEKKFVREMINFGENF